MKFASAICILFFASLSGLIAKPGDYKELGGGWDGTRAMTALDGAIYAVHGGKLYRTDSSGKYTELGDGGWSETSAMCGMDGALWIIDGGKLYRVDKNGKYAEVASGWSKT
ncbi:MAG TPA: hypothetical protein PKA91_10350, partial [Leptospiraceae bacterium]|nr:hypothetical protein [Leptospiraceae bacterium]